MGMGNIPPNITPQQYAQLQLRRNAILQKQQQQQQQLNARGGNPQPMYQQNNRNMNHTMQSSQVPLRSSGNGSVQNSPYPTVQNATTAPDGNGQYWTKVCYNYKNLYQIEFFMFICDYK